MVSLLPAPNNYFIMQSRYHFLLRYFLPVIDIAMLNIVCFMAIYYTRHTGISALPETEKNCFIVCNLIWLFCCTITGLYSGRGDRQLEGIYRGTIRSTLLHAIMFCSYLLSLENTHFAHIFILVFYFKLSILFVINRFIGTALHYTKYNNLKAGKKVAVIGMSGTAEKLVTYLKSRENVNFYGSLEFASDIYTSEGGSLSQRIVDQLKLATAHKVKLLYVSVEPNRMAEIIPFTKAAEKLFIRLKIIPDFDRALLGAYNVSNFGDQFAMVSLRKEPLEDISNRLKKRVFDLLFSSLVIIFILSWLYPVIALLIKLQSPGAVLFKQLRSGRDNEPFYCYKFRSMRINNNSDTLQATKNDDRITGIGQFLRRTSMDELPQFFNVFMGDMSVIGPRPHMIKHTKQYQEIINQFMVRHFLKPGITGWAQVHGLRGETKLKEDMEKRVEHDIWYMENWTAMLDVKITFLTVISLINGDENAF